MAYGFGASGSGAESLDRITSGQTTDAATISLFCWTYRTGEGGQTTGSTLGFGNIISFTGDNIYLCNNQGATTYIFGRGFSTTLGEWSIPRPSANTWAAIGITYARGATTNNPTIYLNGTSQTVTKTSTPAGTANTISGNMYIGNSSAPNAVWDGFIAEVALWNAALNAFEMASLAKGFPPSMMRPASLLEYCPLDRELVSRKLATAPTNSGAVVGDHPPVTVRT